VRVCFCGRELGCDFYCGFGVVVIFCLVRDEYL